MWGSITYKAVVDPARCAICHYQNRQVNAGAAFGWVVHVKDRQFELTSGRIKVFETIANSGRRRCLSFCGDCGTRIHAQTPEEPDAFSDLESALSANVICLSRNNRFGADPRSLGCSISRRSHARKYKTVRD